MKYMQMLGCLSISLVMAGCSFVGHGKSKNIANKRYTVKTLYVLSLDTRFDQTVDEQKIKTIGKKFDYPDTASLNVDGMMNDIKALKEDVVSVDLRLFIQLTATDGSEAFLGINKFGNWGTLNGKKVAFDPTKQSEVRAIISQFN